MTNTKRALSGTMAFLLSLTVMLFSVSSTFGTLLRSSAEGTDAAEEEIWYVPKDADKGNGDDNRLAVSYDATNGASFVSDGSLSNDANFNVYQWWKQGFALDGLTLKFNGLSNAGKTAGIAIRIIGNESAHNVNVNSDALACLIIALDTADGQLRFENAGKTDVSNSIRIRQDGTALISNNLLKYDSLAGKEFTVSFHVAESGNYTVKVTVGGQSVEGTLTADQLNSITSLTQTDRVYVGLSNNRDNSGATSYTLAAIGPVKKVPIALKELTVADIKSQNYWTSNVKVAQSPTGGVKFSYTSGVPSMRMGGMPSVSLDGMYLKLNNLARLPATGNPKFMFNLSNKPDSMLHGNTGYSTDLALCFDTGVGELGLVRSCKGGNATIASDDSIIKNDKLKYDNVARRSIVLRTLKNGDNYNVELAIGTDAPLTGTITKAQLDKAAAGHTGVITDGNEEIATEGNRLTNLDNIYVMLNTASNDRQTFSIDWVELWSSTVTAPKVMEAINAIGAVSLNSGHAIRNARNLYEQLLSMDRPDVTNYSVLEAAEAKFAELAAAEDLALIKMSKANAKLYGSSADDIKNVLAGWPFTVTDLETGGMRFAFSNAGRNVRDGYSGTMSLDGLLLQFDNLQANSAANSKMAILLGNGNNWGTQYSEGQQSFPLAMVLDPEAGTIKAYTSVSTPEDTAKPYKEDATGAVVIAENEALKLENLSGARFSYKFMSRDDGGYDFTVTVGTEEPISGVITADTISKAISMTAPESTDVMLTPWAGGSAFSVDFIGLRQTRMLADDVMRMIDEIGLITVDSKPLIDAAKAAYESLAQTQQNLVTNYDLLSSLESYYEGLDSQAMIRETESLIGAIGAVNFKSGADIRKATDAYDRLTASQKSQVKNAAVYQKALEDFYQLCSDKMIYENYANRISPRFSTGTLGGWWEKTTFDIIENNVLRISWVDAIRDVRNGTALSYDLDGLFLRFANITKDKGQEGAQLSLQIGTGDNHYRGGVNTSSLALVFDTVEGTVTAFPGNRELIRSDLLKHDALAGKEIGVRFSKMEDGLYKMTVTLMDQLSGRAAVSAAERTLSAVIPTSIMTNPVIGLVPSNVMVGLSPWVNNDEGNTDNSTHTFSVDFLSIQSNGVYAFEDLFDLMDRISALPTTVTRDDLAAVSDLLKAYRELPRVLRGYVTNYDLLETAAGQMNELEAEDYSAWENGAAGTDGNRRPANEQQSSGTGDTSTPWIPLAAGTFGIALCTLAYLKLRNNKKMSHLSKGELS